MNTYERLTTVLMMLVCLSGHGCRSVAPPSAAVFNEIAEPAPAEAAAPKAPVHAAEAMTEEPAQGAVTAAEPSPQYLRNESLSRSMTRRTQSPQEETKRIDDYMRQLTESPYAFNPPSPIKVAKPVTVHFWLDPTSTAAQLAQELRRTVPQDADRVESGKALWSPKMRATLRGPGFDVKPVDGNSEEQSISSIQRTTWSWDVTPLHPGEKQTLHLRLEAVLPPELGSTRTIATLDRDIQVDVTLWWLIDHYFEKYWKWLLGGIGSALASAIAWWWKNRYAKNKNEKKENVAKST